MKKTFKDQIRKMGASLRWIFPAHVFDHSSNTWTHQ